MNFMLKCRATVVLPNMQRAYQILRSFMYVHNCLVHRIFPINSQLCTPDCYKVLFCMFSDNFRQLSNSIQVDTFVEVYTSYAVALDRW